MDQCGLCCIAELKPLYRVKSYAPNISEEQENCFAVRMQHTLYYKYSSSQNYHYTKEVNEILQNQRTPANIRFNDFLCLDEEDEYLKRLYELSEYEGKVHLLSEFYKFHRDLPRWTVSKQLLRILNYYYDKKRKLEYYKIQRMIEQENQNNPNQPAKGIVGDRPIESCSTPVSESSETLNVNYNVENILQDITQKESQSLIRFSPPLEEKFYNSPKIFVPPLVLENGKRRVSAEIQQMISMLSINQTLKSQMKDQTPATPQNPPILIENDTPLNLKSGHHFSQKKSTKNEGVFQKKKFMQKKSLRLDELGLSNDEKMPQSARYQTKETRTIQFQKELTARSIQASKYSQTTSRERLSNNEISRDLLKQLKIKPQYQKKPPNTTRNMVLLVKDSYLKGKDGGIKINAPLSNRSLPKKTFNQMMVPTEIKKLEQKVLQGLQEIQQKNMSQKLSSFDQRSLHQILAQYNSSSIRQTHTGSKPVDSFSYYDSQNHSDRQKPPSPQFKMKVGKLDLRKLRSVEVYNGAFTTRTDIANRAQQQKVPFKTDRQVVKKATPLQVASTASNRNSSLYPITPRVSDRKFQGLNNLMAWQIKAIQAAQKEYNLMRK